jgi:hypothetical protein
MVNHNRGDARGLDLRYPRPGNHPPATFQSELANRHGIKIPSFAWVQGYRHFFPDKPIKTPEDLKGLRIRTQILGHLLIR